MIRKTLGKVYQLMEWWSGFVIWAIGITLIGGAVFDIGAIQHFSSHPREVGLSLGILAWSAGSLARNSQKKASRLERKLKRCEQDRDEYRDFWLAESGQNKPEN